MKRIALIAALATATLPAITGGPQAALMSKEEATVRKITIAQYNFGKYEHAISLCETAIEESTPIPENDYPFYKKPETLDPEMLATPIKTLRTHLLELYSHNAKLRSEKSDCEQRHRETVR
ncbi:hypothetical protein [Pelagibius sp. Alg239-R121]|uniref:hypothetical protein n=1 Tax=Pelagibius sp. Alg239-R121 TaxID=2993448 RepID=UPI0024A783A6|nr:hypothetical protein [Pelagibius sp. Alg239-R121]